VVPALALKVMVNGSEVAHAELFEITGAFGAMVSWVHV
jgi:hypothetical protein